MTAVPPAEAMPFARPPLSSNKAKIAPAGMHAERIHVAGDKKFATILQEAKVHNQNSVNKQRNTSSLDIHHDRKKSVSQKNGTDIAAMELAKQYERQLLGILWNFAFDTLPQKFEGGLGEEIFRKELVGEMLQASKSSTTSTIARDVYESLRLDRVEGNNAKGSNKP